MRFGWDFEDRDQVTYEKGSVVEVYYWYDKVEAGGANGKWYRATIVESWDDGTTTVR